MKSRRFVLTRSEDVSGTSGTGRVAEGVEFASAMCVLHWNSEMPSVAVYRNMDEPLRVHGHEGRTKVEFIDS